MDKITKIKDVRNIETCPEIKKKIRNILKDIDLLSAVSTFWFN